MKLIVGLDLGTSTTVAYYRMEGSKEAPHALVDERTSTIPTLLFRREGASQPTEYGVNAEKSVRLQRKGTLIQNFKMDLLKPAGSEERQAAEAHIKEFLSRHIFRLLWDQTLSLNFDTVLLYISYPAKWTPGMSEFMEEIVKEAAQESDKPRRDIQIEVKGVTEPENTVYFTLQKGEDGGAPVICGLFNTFGRVPGSQNGLKITFDIRTKDGRTVTEEFDITGLFSSEEALDHNWLLMEQTITIDPPENPGGGGGFQPEVGDWDDEHHDIII